MIYLLTYFLGQANTVHIGISFNFATNLYTVEFRELYSKCNSWIMMYRQTCGVDSKPMIVKIFKEISHTTAAAAATVFSGQILKSTASFNVSMH